LEKLELLEKPDIFEKNRERKKIDWLSNSKCLNCLCESSASCLSLFDS
jgi:hypothetical protein